MKRLLILVLALSAAACGDDSTAPPGSDQLVVGALLSLTGPGRTLGQTSEAALQLAADDLNARLSANDAPTRVSVRVADTGLDPAQALDRLRTLAGEGVRIFVGPQSSSEVAALKPFADSAGVILLSQGSTATYGLSNALLHQDAELIGTVADRSGLAPDAFTLAAYDALHVATLAYAAVGLDVIETYRTELLTQAGDYTGATGPTDLTTAGDRAVGDYDFYQVCGGPTPAWQRVTAYEAAGGSLVSVGAC